MRKIQIILFWLNYTQKAHFIAQTFFNIIGLQEHFTDAVLYPSIEVTENALRCTLPTTFVQETADPIKLWAAASHYDPVPFSNPFGKSVLRCGIEPCGASIYDEDNQDVSPRDSEKIRKARAKHLINIFGIRGRFENSGTGLPKPVMAGKPPASIHFNLRIGVART
ncbi:hypothetical protein DPSP01_013838 [Paraphaeosphaeria sporulosa]